MVITTVMVVLCCFTTVQGVPFATRTNRVICVYIIRRFDGFSFFDFFRFYDVIIIFYSRRILNNLHSLKFSNDMPVLFYFDYGYSVVFEVRSLN